MATSLAASRTPVTLRQGRQVQFHDLPPRLCRGWLAWEDASLGPFENEEPKKMLAMSGLMHRVWNSIRNETDTQVKPLIAVLENYMQGKVKAKSDF